MAKIKQKAEDFKVTEVLQEKLQSRGKHRVYRLWKKGLETEEALRKIAKSSGIPIKTISHGGLKDKNAITEQFISVPEKFRLKELSFPDLKLSFSGFLDRPISPSIVKGNLFEILVRNGKPPEDRIKILEKYGIPNYYGEQRFTSVRGNELFAKHLSSGDLKNALLYLFRPAGWEGSRSRKGKKFFLKGDYKTAAQLLSGWRKKVSLFLERNPADFEGAFKLIPKSEISFQLNVLQSYLFNEYLKELIKAKTTNYLTFKYKMGTMIFPIEKVEILEKLPAFTPDMEIPFYEEKLEELNIDKRGLEKFSRLFHRFKRKTVVPIRNFKVQEVKEGTLFKFFLPSGSYATNVIRFLYDAV